MDRAQKRAALVALLETLEGEDAGDLVEVYDHQVKDFGRRSPVAMVHSDGTNPIRNRPYWNDRFIVTLLHSREDGDATEDAMDALSRRVIDLLLDNSNIASLRVVDEFTEMDYPIIDGVMYRRESLRVMV